MAIVNKRKITNKIIALSILFIIIIRNSVLSSEKNIIEDNFNSANVEVLEIAEEEPKYNNNFNSRMNMPIGFLPLNTLENIFYSKGIENVKYQFDIPSDGYVEIKFEKEYFDNEEVNWTIGVTDVIQKEFFLYDFVESKNVEGEYITYTIGLDEGTYTLMLEIELTIDSGEYSTNVMINHKDYSAEESDWREHWASKEIGYAMNNGWINNTNIFRVNDAITRAESVKIINRAFGFTSKADSENFKDVSSEDWWYDEVLIAIEAGYITSKNEVFRPNDLITREEIAAMITSIQGNKDSNLENLQNYIDRDLVSNWAKSSVEGVIKAGYMGKNSNVFNPNKYITRAETVVTIFRAVE